MIAGFFLMACSGQIGGGGLQRGATLDLPTLDVALRFDDDQPDRGYRRSAFVLGSGLSCGDVQDQVVELTEPSSLPPTATHPAWTRSLVVVEWTLRAVGR